MSSRTYLSIGDVLTLLREEFPDVTISKIRFLESQGLVNPERSPSGYRKFFDHDVERLRWVLRQQREHFLPLKVIRDRLADGDLDDVGAEGPNGKPAHAASGGVAGVTEQPTKADEEAMARILADASRRAARMPETTQARHGLQVVAEGDAAEGAHATGEPGSGRGRAPAPTVPERGAGGGTSGASAGDPSPAPRSAGRAAAAATGPGNGSSGSRRADRVATGARTPGAGEAAPRKGAAAAGAAGRAPAAAATTGMVTGASLTADELCAASGLPPEEVAGLEGFGLIESVMVAGIPTYDEDALTVANLAAAFGAFGIEPRHLRLYRNAVDREMGLIEQVVIPLLRQRNPESRQRALDGAEQLAALGQSLRATLLRLALRRHLGG